MQVSVDNFACEVEVALAAVEVDHASVLLERVCLVLMMHQRLGPDSHFGENLPLLAADVAIQATARNQQDLLASSSGVPVQLSSDVAPEIASRKQDGATARET